MVWIVLLLLSVAAAGYWGLRRSGFRLPFLGGAGPAAVRDVTWPRFEVKGIGAPSDGSPGMVMIGKEILDVGQVSRQGIRVVEARGRDVVLEYQGQQRVFAAGEGER